MKQYRLVGVLLGFGFAIAPALAEKATPHFTKSCTVYSEASMDSSPVCDKDAGQEVEFAQAVKGGFINVELADCFGFVQHHCISFAAVDEEGTPEKMRTSDSHALGTSLSAGLAGDVLWGSVPYSTQASSGWGAQLGVLLALPIGGWGRVSFGPNLQLLSLSRAIDGSGAVTDSTPYEVKQKNWYIGATALFGILADTSYSPSGNREWWIDAGAQYLYPVSSTQTDNASGNVTPGSPDKLLLVMLGPSGVFPLGGTVSLAGSLQAYLNVGATDGSRLYGLRLGLALQFGL